MPSLKKKKKVSDKTRIRFLQNAVKLLKNSALESNRYIDQLNDKILALANREIEPRPGIDAATVPLVARIGFLEGEIKRAIGMTHPDRTKVLTEALNPPVVGEAE